MNVDASDMRSLQKHRDRTERFNFQRGGYRNAIFGDVKDRALDGQLLRFNTPFPNPQSGRLVSFEPDAFGDVSKQTVSFCIDHELSSEVATTDNGLYLVADDDSFKFRLDLEQATNGRVIAHLCEIGNREAMSVHCDILESRITTISGRSVQVVSSARLVEVSLCRNGAAGDDAFAMVVDTTVTAKPEAGSRSTKLRAYNAMYKVSRRMRELKASDAALLVLSDRIAALSESASPVIQSMTIDLSNRLKTEQYDELAANAMQRLRRC